MGILSESVHENTAKHLEIVLKFALTNPINKKFSNIFVSMVPKRMW